MKANFDKSRKPATKYSKGDLVLWKSSNNISCSGVNKKLKGKFGGPYKITKVISNDRYKIRSIKGMRGYKNFTAMVAADSLRKYKSGIENSESSEIDGNVDHDLLEN